MQLLHGGLVTIFGGSGFAGRYATRECARRGWRIRAACRRPDLAGHLQPMGAVGQIHAVQSNLRFPDSIAPVLEGSEAVVNCVGILTPQGRQNFTAVHVDGARAVARAARLAGVSRLIHVSALGADADSPSRYARTKAAGEQAVLEEFPSAIILRPSVLFGAEDQFFNRFATMARFSPVLPLIGGGRTRFQPLFVGDLGTAITNAVEGAGAPGEIHELGGPEVLTFRQILDHVQEWSGRPRRYVNLPFWLAKLMAAATSPLPNSLRPLTVDQVRLLQGDKVVSEAAEAEQRTIESLGVENLSAAGLIVPLYLERFHPKGQYAHYR